MAGHGTGRRRVDRDLLDAFLEEAATERVPPVAPPAADPAPEDTVTERMAPFRRSGSGGARGGVGSATGFVRPPGLAEVAHELRESRSLRTADLVPVFSEWATELVPPPHATTKPLLPDAVLQPPSTARSRPVSLPRLEPIHPRPSAPTPSPPGPSRAGRRPGPTLAAAMVLLWLAAAVVLALVAAGAWLVWVVS